MRRGVVTAGKPTRRYRKKKTLLLISMVAPAAIWLILLRYLPMFGIVIAFKDYTFYAKDPTLINNIIHSEWAGFNNFKFLFTSSNAITAVKNTIMYNGIWIILGLVVAVAFAIMLNEVRNKFLAKTFQTTMFFPYFLSWVVASYFLLAFLDPSRGLLTTIQKNAGEIPMNWYHENGPWPFLLTLSYLWKNVGYSTILYLAAITGIDGSQYEAAAIDGATKWQQIKYVTLPHLRPMICILLIMNVGKIFNADFGLFWNMPMQSGSLMRTTEVIDTFIYRAMTNTSNLGMSTAAGFLQNVVGFIFIMSANAIVRKIDSDSSLF